MKVVIATEGTDFFLSYKVILEYCKIKGYDVYPYVEHCEYNPSMCWYKLCFDPDELDSGHMVCLLNRNYGETFECEIIEDDMWLYPDELLHIECSSCADVRTDPTLIKAIENIGVENSGRKNDMFKCVLKIHDIPDDVEWELEIYDCGGEAIREVSRIWD